MKITIFNSKTTRSKVPVSPFGNREFIFEPKKVEDIKEVYNYLTQNFILNIPLTKKVQSRRRGNELNDFFIKKLEYLIIDIDHIKSFSDRELCIKFFRDNNYCCVIGESRNPLNLKGVLKVDTTLDKSKLILDEINEKIKNYGDYDYSVIGKATYQAPTYKYNILYENLSGITYPTPDVKDFKKINTGNTDNFLIPKNIQEICKNEFMKRGYNFHETKENLIQVSHPTEKKSPKGFWWYPTNPYIMHHFNETRKENIWNDIIKTKEYKEFIYDKSKFELTEIFKTNSNNKVYEVKERYLKKHSDKIKEFFSEDNNFKILKIQSPMGTGKSTIIHEVLNQSKIDDLRILFITNRI